MGKYSGILLCTDYDGTFSCGKIPENNIEAVQRFMADGGWFTYSTGRGGSGMTACEVMPNVPMIGMSGAELYDVSTGMPVERYFMERDACAAQMERMLLGAGRVEHVARAEGCMAQHSLNIDCSAESEIRLGIASIDDVVLKVVFWMQQDQVENFIIPENACRLCRNVFELTSNGPATFEMTRFGVNKGYGVLRLKAFTGASRLICAGDYLGDITMLCAADVGYAVENAHADVKAAADRVTIPAWDGAIAQIIAEL